MKERKEVVYIGGHSTEDDGEEEGGDETDLVGLGILLVLHCMNNAVNL